MTHKRKPGPRTGALKVAGGRAPRPPAPAPRSRAAGDTRSRLERIVAGDGQQYVLRLYITGMSRTSRDALERVREFCETRLKGRYTLDVIDIYQLPALAKDEQIVATPTLIRVLPAPLRRFIGNLSTLDRFLFGMDLRPRP